MFTKRYAIEVTEFVGFVHALRVKSARVDFREVYI